MNAHMTRETGVRANRTWWALTWLSLAVAALIAMDQIGAIIQEATPGGEFSVTTFFGIGQLLSTNLTATTNTLNAWASAATQFGSLPIWLYIHLAFDALFIIGYGLLGFCLLPSDEEPAAWLLGVLIAADSVENAIAAAAFARVAGHQNALFPLTLALHLATMIKWLAALAFVVRMAYRVWDSRSARDAIRHFFSALAVQRFSVVIVVLLIVLAAGRGADVLEQMPDVQRAWLSSHPGMGWVHAAVAATAQVLLALMLVFLGRMRTRRAREKFSGRDRRRNPGYLPWIAVPAILAVLAVLLWLTGAAEIGWWRLGVAIAVPVLIAVSSMVIAWRVRRRRAFSADAISRRQWLAKRLRGSPGEELTSHRTLDRDGVRSLGHSLPEPQPEMVPSVRTAGDELAVAVAAVTGLGLVRSFTAPALLASDGYAVASWVAVALGFIAATACWPLANGPARNYLRRLADARPPRGPAARLADWARQGRMAKKSPWWPWLVVGGPFLVADVGLLFVPLWTAHWLGVLGTTVIAVGTLTVVLAVLAYLAQARRPLPLFRMIRLNVTPVITIVAVIGLVGAIADSRSLVHVIRGPAGGIAASGQPGGTTLLSALQSWLADRQTTTCAVPVAGGAAAGAGRPVRVEPLILVAAAGGGIRAAWWAEHALGRIADTKCGPHDVFAVSSVSGGSVGVAVLDSAPTTGQADADIARMAGPDALAAGIDGLLLHDLIAGYTGLDLPSAQMPAGQQFSDRAGLIESAWQSEDGKLSQPFPLTHPVLPWRLLFNSAAVGSGCRVIIADSLLPGTPPGSSQPDPTCDLRSAVPGGGSYDFFAMASCRRNIATATAAMLSARFPYITPSGVVMGCDGRLMGQFVDGGYVDSSGLMTLADLMPSLTSALRAHNATALAQARPGQPVTLVVPVVVYLGNSPRPAPVASAVSLVQEPFVPIDAQSAAGAELGTSDTLLQRLMGLTGNGQWLQCVPALAGCAAAESAAQKTVGDQIIFVAPRIQPQISPPLGWVLSAASSSALKSALTAEAANRCLPPSQPAQCPPGVGRLADLLQLTQGG
jgi:uncharacterized membrane protein